MVYFESRVFQSAKSKVITANQKNSIEILNTYTFPIISNSNTSNIANSIQITRVEKNVVKWPYLIPAGVLALEYEYIKFDVIGAITISPTNNTNVSNWALSIVETSLSANK